MNALICDAVPSDLTALRAYAIHGAVALSSVREKQEAPCENARFRVALLDYGAKHNIVRELNKRGCHVSILPHDTAAEDVLAGGYDGVMLSNGPGDPAENAFEIAQIQKLMGKLPVFGICLGHQLMAPCAGRRDGEAQVRPPARQPAGARPDGRAHAHHLAEPRLRRQDGRRARRFALYQRQRWGPARGWTTRR